MGQQIRIVDLAHEVVRDKSDEERIQLTLEICYCVTDPSKNTALTEVAVKIARYSHILRQAAIEKMLSDAEHLPDTEFTAPLAEIPPKVGHTPEGGNGPSLRLPVAQCWGHQKRVTHW